MIKTTKTTYCPKKLITNNYLLTICCTSKKIIIYRLKMFIHQESCKVFLGSSLFKYLKNFFQNESVKAVIAHTFPPGMRNGNAGVSRREIAVFDLQA